MKKFLPFVLLLAVACGEQKQIEFNVISAKSCDAEPTAEVNACLEMCSVAGNQESSDLATQKDCRDQCAVRVKRIELCSTDQEGNTSCDECNVKRTGIRSHGYVCSYEDSCPGGASWEFREH